MEEVVDLVLVAIAFIALIFASITDIKRKEIPNWLNYSLIVVALAIRGIAALLFNDFSFFYWALIAGAIVYLLGELLYYSQTFGGGDTRLFIALAVCFATTPYFAKPVFFGFVNEPFILTLLINSLLLGSIFGILMAIVGFIRVKEKKKFFREIKNINKKLTLVKVICFALAIISLIAVFVFKEPVILIASLLFLILPYLYAFIKAIENHIFVKFVSPEKVTEGDSLFENVKIGRQVIKKSVHGLSKKDIALLKKAKRKVLIREGLIFVPIVVIALIISLFYGDILLEIIKAFVF